MISDIVILDALNHIRAVVRFPVFFTKIGVLHTFL